MGDRGSDFDLYYKIFFFIVLFSTEKGFKGEVKEYENEAHCAAEDN